MDLEMHVETDEGEVVNVANDDGSRSPRLDHSTQPRVSSLEALLDRVEAVMHQVQGDQSMVATSIASLEERLKGDLRGMAEEIDHRLEQMDNRIQHGDQRLGELRAEFGGGRKIPPRLDSEPEDDNPIDRPRHGREVEKRTASQ